MTVRDHPRVRGEHCSTAYQGRKAGGSSPRARGALDGTEEAAGLAGIIPACAGSTPCSSVNTRFAGDHPRVRGEHPLGVVTENPFGGSSPRARGAPGRGEADGQGWGIIPACAGSTGAQPGHDPVGRDHPRVRGEHRGVPGAGGAYVGSSPRARGAQVVPVHQELVQGIIPACAGSTRCECRREGLQGDHPRVRGEHRPEDQ